jgi:hypothetical protein
MVTKFMLGKEQLHVKQLSDAGSSGILADLNGPHQVKVVATR